VLWEIGRLPLQTRCRLGEIGFPSSADRTEGILLRRRGRAGGIQRRARGMPKRHDRWNPYQLLGLASSRREEWKQDHFLLRTFPKWFVDADRLLLVLAEGRHVPSWSFEPRRVIYKHKRRFAAGQWEGTTAGASAAAADGWPHSFSTDQRAVFEVWEPAERQRLYVYVATQSTWASGPLWLDACQNRQRGHNLVVCRDLWQLVRLGLTSEERSRFGLRYRFRFSARALALLAEVLSSGDLAVVVHGYAWLW